MLTASQIAEIESINTEMLRICREKDGLKCKKEEISERLHRAELISATKKQQRMAQVKKQLEQDFKVLEELRASENLHGKRADREYVDEAVRILKTVDVRGVERVYAEAYYLKALYKVEEYEIPSELKILKTANRTTRWKRRKRL